jgi:hypothetical protein
MISDLLKNALPTYDVFLPITKKKHKFRPMTVREEKILLIAQQTGSIKEMGYALVTIIKNCFYDIPNPENLPIADAERAFLAVRAKSIGENATFYIRCPETQETVTSKINLESFDLPKQDNSEIKIKLSDDMVLVMKYPTLKYLCEEEEDDEAKKQFKLCFAELQTKDNSVKKNELTDEELSDFYDNMTSLQLNKFLDYLQTTPRLRKTITYKTKDGLERQLEIYGIDSFFAFASAT